MNCPACGQALPHGSLTRCPHCAALVAGPEEGALAPSPQPVTPPTGAKPEPLREIPGLRKRERTWRDEVRDRVRHRRQQRAGGEDLPLFRDTEEHEADEPPLSPAASPPPAASSEEGFAPGPHELGDEPVSEAEVDLPRRRFGPPPAEREPETAPASAELLAAGHDGEEEREWRLDAPVAVADPRPIERPAQAGERAQAAIVDLVLMLGVWAVVVYFASRAARVGLFGLRPSWPYLLTYLAFLGLTYAACFTGVTGQTLGKMLTGLRVVNAAGRPPGCPRAFLRAAVGSLGVVLVFGGIVPILFDPARRGLHDRLLKTRVVKG